MLIKNLPKRFLKPLVQWGEVDSFRGLPADTTRSVSDAKLSRHDHHNLEVKAWMEPGSADYQTELDCFIFIPSSFQVASWEKPDLLEDFRSRVRLALPSRTGESASTVKNSADLLRQIQRLLDKKTSDTAEYKEIGGLLSEVLKRRGSIHRRAFRMAHSLSISPLLRATELSHLWKEVADTAQLLQNSRSLLAQQPPGLDSVLVLLDEYLSNFYVHYLSKLRSTLEEMDPQSKEKADSEEYRRAWDLFDLGLQDLQKQEAVYRQKFPERVEHASNAAAQESAIVRLGQLKKFFQSRMFVDVALHSPSSRFAETTAVLGTALAGLCWAGVQVFNRPDLAATANPGSFFLGFAVLTYVLRDRIKDRAKVSLHRRVQKLLPDLNRDRKSVV